MDYTFGDQNGSFTSNYRQAIVFLPAPRSGLHPFDLCRRGFFDRLFRGGLVGDTCTTDMPSKDQLPHLRKYIEHFRIQYGLRRYYLSDHFEQAAGGASLQDCIRDFSQFCRSFLSLLYNGKLAIDPQHTPLKGRGQVDNGLDPGRAGSEAEIRRFFKLDLLQFFADHLGWCIQSDGAHLALWCPGDTIRNAQRPRFVAEALQFYRAFARTGALEAPRPRVDQQV